MSLCALKINHVITGLNIGAEPLEQMTTWSSVCMLSSLAMVNFNLTIMYYSVLARKRGGIHLVSQFFSVSF